MSWRGGFLPPNAVCGKMVDTAWLLAPLMSGVSFQGRRCLGRWQENRLDNTWKTPGFRHRPCGTKRAGEAAVLSSPGFPWTARGPRSTMGHGAHILLDRTTIRTPGVAHSTGGGGSRRGRRAGPGGFAVQPPGYDRSKRFGLLPSGQSDEIILADGLHEKRVAPGGQFPSPAHGDRFR
jgi:hypothetical protein